MKVSVINAYGRSNRGDSVLLDECISEIRQIGPDASIAVAVFEGVEKASALYPDVSWGERIGNARGNGLFGRLEALYYLGVAWIAALWPSSNMSSRLPPEQRKTLDAIRECEIVISAPGGYIHDTNFAYFIALFHIHIAKVLGRTVILAPQSIGPIKGKFSRWAARKVLAECDFVCPRESYSYDFLVGGLGLNPSNIRPCGDSAFWNFQVDDDSKAVDRALADIGVPEGEKILGVTAVGWNFPRHPDPAAAYDAYVRRTAEIIDRVASKHGLTPVIFNQVSDDIPTARRIASAATSNVVVDDVSREPDALRAMIGRSSVFLGTRFHSCIFAMMAHVPTVAIAYLPKTTFIMKDLGFAAREVPIDAVDVDKVVELLGHDLLRLPAARQDVCDATARYREKFGRLKNVIAEAYGTNL